METEICYPFSLTEDGDLAVTSSRVEQCRQAILAGLKTYQGERVYRPEFGIVDEVFHTSRIAQSLGMVRQALSQTLKDYSDATYELSGYEDDGGRFVVVVNYHIDETSDIVITELN